MLVDEVEYVRAEQIGSVKAGLSRRAIHEVLRVLGRGGMHVLLLAEEAGRGSVCVTEMVSWQGRVHFRSERIGAS